MDVTARVRAGPGGVGAGWSNVAVPITDASTTYRLVPPAPPGSPPRLDEHQQRVVDHAGGPLLVLAGPGTGKTTTLVEAIVDRVERRGANPGAVLALTFSRKAAEQLRDRVTARLGRTTATTMSATFHSFAYGLVRRYAPTELYAAPLRLLSAPEADVVVQELLARESRGGALARVVARRRAAPVGSPARCRRSWRAPASAVSTPTTWSRSAGASRCPSWRRPATSSPSTSTSSATRLPWTTPTSWSARSSRRAGTARSCAARSATSSSTSTRTPTPVRSTCCESWPGDGRDLVVVGDPDQSIYGFRGAEVRGILDFPAAFAYPDGRPADVVALGTTRRFGSRMLRASRAVAAGIATSGSIPREQYAAFRSPVPAPGPHGSGVVDVLTFDTARAESEHIADLLRRAHLEDGVPWSQMAVLVRSGRASIPPLRRSLGAAGVPVEVAGDETPLTDEPSVRPLLEALSAVVDSDVDDPARPEHLGADRAHALLVSPLGGLDATDVRVLTRELRREHPSRTTQDLLRAAVLDPAVTADLSDPRAHRLASLVGRARVSLDAGATVEEVLWLLWDGVEWGRRLQTDRRRRRSRGPRRPSRPRCRVCALRDRGARRGEARPHQCAGVPRDAARAAHPGRHPGRPRRAGRGRPAADRPPGQGAGVAPGGGGPGPGGGVARPATSRHAPARRPDRERRVGGALHPCGPARRGASVSSTSPAPGLASDSW